MVIAPQDCQSLSTLKKQFMTCLGLVPAKAVVVLHLKAIRENHWSLIRLFIVIIINVCHYNNTIDGLKSVLHVQ
jgi:hypothetical protein